MGTGQPGNVGPPPANIPHGGSEYGGGPLRMTSQGVPYGQLANLPLNASLNVAHGHGRYPTCCAESFAETKSNSSTDPHPHHCKESCSWSLVVKVEQESNLDELPDLNGSRSCNGLPASSIDANTTHAWDNNGVFAKKSVVSLISIDFDCSSTSPSRSSLLLPSSPAQEAEAALAWS
ncbi:hypothetical protein L7F22_064114 [Adiantum nelumboides]|nr:hypothetical protein [Adiantum nelumboides]